VAARSQQPATPSVISNAQRRAEAVLFVLAADARGEA
jgi:hypothetical protein